MKKFISGMCIGAVVFCLFYFKLISIKEFAFVLGGAVVATVVLAVMYVND